MLNCRGCGIVQIIIPVIISLYYMISVARVYSLAIMWVGYCPCSFYHYWRLMERNRPYWPSSGDSFHNSPKPIVLHFSNVISVFLFKKHFKTFQSFVWLLMLTIKMKTVLSTAIFITFKTFLHPVIITTGGWKQNMFNCSFILTDLEWCPFHTLVYRYNTLD